MLSEFQISNFKSISKLVKVPVKPITLIFGANSSGKSSILQTLLMLKQTIETPNHASPLLSESDLVKLGGYKDFIYRHDKEKELYLRFNILLPENAECYFDFFDSFDVIQANNIFQNLMEILEKYSLGLGVTFSYNHADGLIYIPSIELFIDDEPYPIMVFSKSVSVTEYHLSYFNEKHKFWETYWSFFEEQKSKEVENILVDKTLAEMLAELDKKTNFKPTEKKDEKERIDDTTEKRILMEKLNKVLIEVKQKIRYQIENEMSMMPFESALQAYKANYKNDVLTLTNFLPNLLNKNNLRYLSSELNHDEWDSRKLPVLYLIFAHLFSQFLKDIIYIGPVRQLPERHFISSATISKTVGKYGENIVNILATDNELLKKVNEALDQLQLGYKLCVSRLSDEASEVDELIILRLKEKSTGTFVMPSDVGFGISQILPVVFHSIISKGRTILIEQPELHLHPALQTELGDLFIKSAFGGHKNKFIIETHSEHLILRILRRIREASEGGLPEGVPEIYANDVSVLYVQKGENGAEVIHIPINDDGEFDIPWPNGFFAERAEELF